MDESGTSEIPGNSSHFVLAGLSIPIWHWKICESAIDSIRKRYHLENAEIHTAWLLRPYLEQNKIPDFSTLNHEKRRRAVREFRVRELHRLQKKKPSKSYRQTKKNYSNTDDYVHLTYQERTDFVRDIAVCVSGWGFARLFAEAIDKAHFESMPGTETVGKQAFEQVVSRFDQYLENTDKSRPPQKYGLLIHDNNQTVEKKHTELMKEFHSKGTRWTRINRIIETPLFVDSRLTSMVQIADLCAYSLRRYLERGENTLFDFVFKRADRIGDITVGVRHYAENCNCKICDAHKAKYTNW